MERLAKPFNHNFDNGNFFLFNKNGHKVYVEHSDGYQEIMEYNKDGNQTYFSNSKGFWMKAEYDKDKNQVYYENSNGAIINTINIIKVNGKTYRLVEE